MQSPADPIVSTKSDVKNQGVQTQAQSEFEPLLDVIEAAKLLRIHPKTLRRKARRGVIPGMQVGRRWRFRASELNHWLLTLAS